MRRHTEGDGEEGNWLLSPGKVQRTTRVEYLQGQVQRYTQKQKINNNMRVKTKVEVKLHDNTLSNHNCCSSTALPDDSCRIITNETLETA